jgi:uncharacterized protein (TIGR02453 family)
MAPHFTSEALKFLRGLARNNDREWFNARKSIYENELKAPMLALIEQINEAMFAFAPEHVRPPNKVMLRIYRDTRFSADKSPYKKQIAAWWARSGMEKTSGAGFYFHLSAKEIHIAAGIYMPTPDQLLAIRRKLLEDYEQFRALLANSRLKSKMEEIDGLALTRAPRGFPADSPAKDLICQRQWGVSAVLLADRATLPTFAADITSRFALATPVVDFLNAALVGHGK